MEPAEKTTYMCPTLSNLDELVLTWTRFNNISS